MKECPLVPEKQSKQTFSRRDALAVIPGTAYAAISHPVSGRATEGVRSPAAVVPAVAPHPEEFVPQVSFQSEPETISTIAELIISPDTHSPGAQAARFISEEVKRGNLRVY